MYRTFARIESEQHKQAELAKERERRGGAAAALDKSKAKKVATKVPAPVDDEDKAFDFDDIDSEGEPQLESDSEEEPQLEYDDPSNTDDLEDYIPEPRNAARGGGGNKVKFLHTPRLFPTPMRESTQGQEGDFIAKNRKNLKTHPQFKKVAMRMDVTESDPMWLKGKGDDFYRAGDFLSAINAYTSAIDIDETIAPALSNRAACHLQTGDLAACVDDCNKALEFIPEKLPAIASAAQRAQNTKLRLRVIVRRGTAHCQMGDYTAGGQDYELAKVLDPDNVALKADTARVVTLVKCAALKAEGDVLFKEQELERAVGVYTEALVLEPQFVSAISNRAAANLALGRGR